MTTINAVGNGLSGATGSGNFAASDSPVFTTQITTPQLTFNSSTQGIPGITSGSSKSSGYVGEIIQSVITSSSGVAIANTTVNVTSIPLTAGLWQIDGNVTINGTLVTTIDVWISTTSATIPDQSLYSSINGATSSAIQGLTCPTVTLNISGSTTVYLSAHSPSTGTVCGGIYALRVA